MTGTEVSRPLEWLLAHTPHQTDVALQQKLPDVAVKTTFRFPEGGDPYEIVESVTRPRGITQERIDEIIATLLSATAPAPHSQTLQWLERMKSITATKKEDEPLTVDRLKNLTEELRAFPADVVKAALHEPRTWFPTWGELHKTLLTLSSRRRRLLEEVRRWQPWSNEDEIAFLRKAHGEARHEEHFYANKNPKRSKIAANRADQIASDIKAIEDGDGLQKTA